MKIRQAFLAELHAIRIIGIGGFGNGLRKEHFVKEES
jgi:hypothetical protein